MAMANHSCVVELQKKTAYHRDVSLSAFDSSSKIKKQNEWFQTWTMISLSGSILPNSGPIPVHFPRKLWIQPTQIGKGLLVVNILGISSYWCFYYIGIYWLYIYIQYIYIPISEKSGMLMDFHAMPHFGAWKNPSSSPVADWDPAQPHSEDTGEWAHSSCQGKNPADHMGKSWKIYQKPWVFPDFDHSWCSSQKWWMGTWRLFTTKV